MEACARAFVAAVERRRRRVYVPRAIGAVQAMRSAMVSPLRRSRGSAGGAPSQPQMEAEVRALDRAFGEHSAASGEMP